MRRDGRRRQRDRAVQAVLQGQCPRPEQDQSQLRREKYCIQEENVEEGVEAVLCSGYFFILIILLMRSRRKCTLCWYSQSHSRLYPDSRVRAELQAVGVMFSINDGKNELNLFFSEIRSSNISSISHSISF